MKYITLATFQRNKRFWFGWNFSNRISNNTWCVLSSWINGKTDLKLDSLMNVNLTNPRSVYRASFLRRFLSINSIWPIFQNIKNFKEKKTTGKSLVREGIFHVLESQNKLLFHFVTRPYNFFSLYLNVYQGSNLMLALTLSKISVRWNGMLVWCAV